MDAEHISDYQFFRENQQRNYRLRVATPAEEEKLKADGSYAALYPQADDVLYLVAAIYRTIWNVGTKFFASAPGLVDSEAEARQAYEHYGTSIQPRGA